MGNVSRSTGQFWQSWVWPEWQMQKKWRTAVLPLGGTCARHLTHGCGKGPWAHRADEGVRLCTHGIPPPPQTCVYSKFSECTGILNMPPKPEKSPPPHRHPPLPAQTASVRIQNADILYEPHLNSTCKTSIWSYPRNMMSLVQICGFGPTFRTRSCSISSAKRFTRSTTSASSN